MRQVLIIEAPNGTIGVSSAPGRGSRFRISLPLNDPPSSFPKDGET